MIVASPWNYASNFFEFAKKFIHAVSAGDFGTAFSGLDQSCHKWSRDEFLKLLRDHESGQVTSPHGHARSASPQILTVEPNDVFEVSHRLPIDGSWSTTVVCFRFVRGKGEYFKVHLLGIAKADAETWASAARSASRPPPVLEATLNGVSQFPAPAGPQN